MITDTEGLVLKQIRTAGGRRMIVLFTKRFGKISAGTSINEGGRNKTALALKPFTYGRYELFCSRESYNINAAETLQSFYSIGENIDKFMAASYGLELTERLAQEEQPAGGLLTLIKDYLGMLDRRKSAFGTLVCGFQLKALSLEGSAPQLMRCVRTGSTENLRWFSVADGGVLSEAAFAGSPSGDPLLFELPEQLLSAMRYMDKKPITALEGIGLSEELEKKLSRILKAYYAYHLGIEGLRSESLQI